MWSGWALVALAFSDDFETGALTRWSGTRMNHPAVSFGVRDGGAHRGAFGLTVTDSEGGSGESSHNYVELGIVPAETDLYARYWIRVRENNGAGYVVTAWMLGTSNGFISTESGFDATHLFIHGYNRDGGEVNVPEQQRYDAGSWHLVEIATTGGGSPMGHRLLFVDGLKLADSAGDFTGQPTLGLTLGQPYAENTWQGVIDFDDFRTSTSTHASTLGLTQLGDGGEPCVPLLVELYASVGERKQAPYAFVAELFVDAGSVHGGSGCSGPATVFFDAGAGAVAASWRPDVSGFTAARAEYVDFMSRADLLFADGMAADSGVVAPDAGTTGERSTRVGCGCDASPGIALAILWASVWRRRRRVEIARV